MCRVVVELDGRLVLSAALVVDQSSRLGVGLVLGVAGEDDHEPATTLRQQVQGLGVHPAFPLERDEPVVEALQLLGLMRRDVRRGVRRAGDVRVAQHDQRLGGRLGDQAQLGVQDRDQRALAAGQRSGHVEALLGQQRVKVVARYPARDLRVALGDLIRAGLQQLPQGAVDPGAPASGRDDGRVLLVAGRPGPEPLAVMSQHLEPDQVVDRLAVGLRGRPAGVVADHPAQRAVIVGGRLRAEHQPVRSQLRIELVQHARPARCPARPRRFSHLDRR